MSKPCVEYYVFESNHVSKFKEKDFKRFPSDLTQKLFTLNLTRDPLEFTKKPGGPKIIPTIFLAAATLSAVKNIVVIIFGHPGFIGLFDFVCRFPTHHVEFQVKSARTCARTTTKTNENRRQNFSFLLDKACD